MEAINMAAMREALRAALDLIFDMQNADRSPLSNQAYAVRRKIKAALASPLRNCERFQTKDAAKEAFQKLRGHRVWADVSLWDDRDEIEAFLDWLFATGKEGGDNAAK